MAQGVKDWITVNGQHVPIFEGQTKQQAVESAIKHQQNTKKDADDRERQLNVNKEQANQKYQYFKGKKVTQEEFERLRNEQALSSRKESIKDPKDLIPKGTDYTDNTEYKQAQEWLHNHSAELQEVKESWLSAYKELEQAQDKHLDPNLVKKLGKPQARMFVWDEDYPDTAEVRKKVDQLDSKRKELEEEVRKYQSVMNRYDTQNSKKQREEYGRPEFKEAKGNYPGFKLNESTTSNVDRALKEGRAKVVEMTPEQYVRECSHYIFNNSTVQKTLRSRLGNKDTEKYAAMMRQGVKFDTPYIDYTNEGQEGLHRAVAAYMNGIEKMPVIVIGKRR